MVQSKAKAGSDPISGSLGLQPDCIDCEGSD